MSQEYVKSVIDQVIEARYGDWGIVDQKPAPYAWFWDEDHDDMHADDSRYHMVTRWSVGWYTKDRDEDLENELIAVIEEAFGPVRIKHRYVKSQNVFMTALYFTEIERSHNV